MHSVRFRSLVLMLVVGAVGTAPAAMADDCSAAATQMAMDACAAQAYGKADAALNAVYKAIMRRLKSDNATTQLLVKAQRDWLVFRDAECDFVVGSGTTGGTINAMIVTACRTDLTRSRTEQLKPYLRCAEGDPSCPVPPE